MNAALETTEILVIGAGPAGSVAAAMLRRQGRQVLMLERDNVVAPEALGLAALGVDHATGMAAIAPSYLWRYRVGGQFAEAPAH